MNVVVFEGCFGYTINVDGKNEALLTVDELKAVLHKAIDKMDDKEVLLRAVAEVFRNHLSGEFEDVGDCDQCGSCNVNTIYEV